MGILDNSEDYRILQNKMENEGFHYCFVGYSNWEEIEDEEFHRLRLEYRESAKKLEEYVDMKAKEEEEQELEDLLDDNE